MRLQGTDIYVKPLEDADADAEAMLQVELSNREFFQNFTPTRNEHWYTLEGQRNRIEMNREMRELDERYSFAIYLNETDACIGSIALTEVLRGSLQGCFIGYSLDQHYNGRGYMTEAVALVVKFAFEELRLHRIEAGVMPHNIGSIKVLEKVGFHKEGIAQKNVKINGRWEDHQILAIINPDETI